MRKIKRAVKRRVSRKIQGQSLTWFVLSGLWHDFRVLLMVFTKVMSYPVHVAAGAIHKQIKHYPQFRIVHHRTFIYVSLGTTLMITSFLIEGLFHHAIWAFTIETMRAGGACPLWDTISSVTKIDEDLRG